MVDSHASNELVNSFLFYITILAAALICYLSVTPVDIVSQSQLVVAIVLALLLIRQFSHTGVFRIAFLCLSAFVVLRYLTWRTTYTVGYHDFFSFVGALSLYLAEVYGIAMFFLSIVVNSRPIARSSLALPDDASVLPSVDVLIPTFNEEPDLVKVSLVAATAIDYSKEKLNVYLLDDGGTVAKRNDPDEVIAARAMRRRKTLIDLCNQVGAQYLSREQNYSAKCGNLNHALTKVSGDLILVLDADHVATVDILQQTVGHFIEDPRLFLVQSPHFFISPDPIERNLETFSRMPSENRMFYGAIQPGLDFWEASFFCGSAAVIRRKALDESGFSGDTVTEDAETSLKIHAQGWRSRYMKYPLISGLQPQTFASFMIQRVRWAQGMVQLFVLQNPLRQSGLRIWQKISYLSNTLFWFFPFARVVFLIAPSLYLLFGLKIYDASVNELFGYTLPYLFCLLLTDDYLFGKVRWSLVSELYETMQSLFSLRAIIGVLMNPHAPKFAVTPKSETLQNDYISPLARPFYWFVVFTVTAVVAGIWRYLVVADDRGITLVTLFWAGLNMLILVASLGALYEHRQRRSNPRIPANIDARIEPVHGPGRALKVLIKDISIGGASAVMDVADVAAPVPAGQVLILRLFHPVTQTEERIHVSIISHLSAGDQHDYGLRFEPKDLTEYRSIVLLVHGDSRRWRTITEQQDFDPGIIPGMLFLFGTGMRQCGRHIIRILGPLREGRILVLLH